MPRLTALDYLAGTFLTTVAGWAFACTRGPRSAVVATSVLSVAYATLYLKAPARTYPRSEDVTEGVDLKGKVALVTGATSGIGIDTARVLAIRGAHVYLAARNPTKLQETRDTLLAQNPSLQLDVLVCDLSDLDSVKACAAAFLKRHDRLDILINNAGIMALPTRHETKQGLESQVGVCHVGHFYLTMLLLPAVRKAHGRIVCLSSSAHLRHDFGKCLETEKLDTAPYTPWTAYGNAKVANLLHAKGLANKGISAYSVMPGGIMTNLQQHTSWWMWIKYQIAAPLFFKTTNQGAATTLLCATSNDTSVVQVGEYHDNCQAAPKAVQLVLEQVGSDAPERTWTKTEAVLRKLGYNQ